MSGTITNTQTENIARRLESVSPSRYGMLNAWKEGRICALQLLWRGRAPLASYPAAKLGDVVHRMLDRLPASAGETEAKAAWKEALEHTESRLNDNWVTRGLLPLPRTVKRYALKRILAIRSILRSVSVSKSACSAGGQATTMREEDIQSADGLLQGRADLIEKRNGEWVLVDYKSGEVHEDDDESGVQRIKEEYALQLRLYTHLIREAKGIIISKAILRTLDGREHEVAVDEARVLQTGAEARSLLTEFNSEIQRHASPLHLAKPMAASWERGVFGCAGCLFRPLCPAYISCEKKLEQAGERWPRDAWGMVTSIEREGGKVVIQIHNENRLVGQDGETPEPNLTVRLRDSTERHPQLADMEVGQSIQIHDFVVPRLGIIGLDGPRTCVRSGPIVQFGEGG